MSAAALVSSDTLPDLGEAELKHYFMVCDRLSAESLMDPSDAATCSVVYETLKDKFFDGDARALLEWWQQARSAPTPPAAE